MFRDSPPKESTHGQGGPTVDSRTETQDRPPRSRTFVEFLNTVGADKADSWPMQETIPRPMTLKGPAHHPLLGENSGGRMDSLLLNRHFPYLRACPTPVLSRRQESQATGHGKTGWHFVTHGIKTIPLRNAAVGQHFLGRGQIAHIKGAKFGILGAGFVEAHPIDDLFQILGILGP